MNETTTTMTEIFKRDPFAQKLNIELIDWGKGYAKTALTIMEDMLNFHDAAHGGLIFPSLITHLLLQVIHMGKWQ